MTYSLRFRSKVSVIDAYVQKSTKSWHIREHNLKWQPWIYQSSSKLSTDIFQSCTVFSHVVMIKKTKQQKPSEVSLTVISLFRQTPLNVGILRMTRSKDVSSPHTPFQHGLQTCWGGECTPSQLYDYSEALVSEISLHINCLEILSVPHTQKIWEQTIVNKIIFRQLHGSGLFSALEQQTFTD